MDFRFVHAADLHLDSPFKGLRTDPRLRDVVQGATLAAFTRVVDLCLAEQADFLVLAGDLFDARDRSVRARLHLSRELGRLHQAGIPAFLVHGNHDPLRELKPGAGLPPSAKVFGPQWEEVPVLRGGQELCRVQGISYAEEKVAENLALRFKRTTDAFTVGVLHANLGKDASHANFAPCTVMDLAGRGLDYWALGHVHTRAVHSLPGGGLAVYPGNPQGRHVNEDGERGCAVVDVRAGRARVRMVGLEVVRWHRLELDVGSAQTLEDLGELLSERLVDAEGSGPAAFAARVTLKGRGPIHAELSLPGALEQLEEVWREELAGRTPRWALESVRDGTLPELDVQALRASGGLVGAVLDRAFEAQKPALGEDLWAQEELRKLEAALRRHKLPSPREEGAQLLNEAALWVAERLVEDGA